MRVDKLHLQDYGQFHDKDIILAPGINVLYGANEAGKSTTKDFIVDMLYGIDDTDVVGQHNDHYDKKKPIGRDSYKGAMEVSLDGADYEIYRNFDKNEKETIVKDLDKGVNVPLNRAHSLVGTLLQTDRSTYLNTLCIGHMGAATDSSVVEKLNEYIVNMASTKSGDLDAVNAIVELKNKKAEFSNEELLEREKELSDSLFLDRDFDAEIAAVKEEYAKVAATGKEPEQLQFTPIKNSASQELEEELAEESSGEEPVEEETEEPLTKEEKDIAMLKAMGPKSFLDNTMVILFIGLMLIAVFVAIAAVVPVNIPEIKMGIMGAGIVWVVISLIQVFVRRSKLYKLLEELEIEQGFEDAKNGSLDEESKAAIEERLKELKAQEEALVEERANQETYLTELTSIKEQIQKNEIELAALDLAINTIQDLSEEIYASFGSILNDQVSRIFSRITRGKYNEVRIDDKLQIMVKSGNTFISMDYLSTGTIEQIYLALRLTIADLLIPENMPIIMDDSFITYDYQRINDTLACLGEYTNRQIIIFTGNPGIYDMLTNLGMESKYISI